ncbi:MAG: DUF2207 domain-containing protein [Candidatus Bipolaricaulota bacterium]|nr:DUF2207 domain-containing protein [Candidatus Bipolaricaulota bacterium]
MRFLAAALCLVVAVGVCAGATLYIENFDAAVNLTSTGNLDVIETLTVVFVTPHHGIERYITVSDTTRLGKRVTIDLRVGEVTMDGERVPVETRRSGTREYIRIGDPDRTVTGTHVYRIAYTAGRALLFHNDYLQLYWNVTGNEWEIPIRRATAVFALPPGTPMENVSTTSYVGPKGSTALGQPATVDAAGRFVFTAGALNPGSGLTIDISIPRGLLPITPPTFAEKLGRFLWDNKLAALPIATLVFMIVLWYRIGKDPRRGVIAPAFEPPSDLGPGEAGILVDDRMDLRDVSAMVIGLAVGGYLTIREESPDAEAFAEKARAWVGGSSTKYTFVRARRSPDDLSAAERALYDAIFPDAEAKETSLDSLENRFYKHLPTIRMRLFEELIEKKLYARNPERVRASYAGWAGALVAAGVGAGVVFASVYAGVALALSGLVVLAFSPIMPRKTVKGTQALVEVLGLSEYIHRAEVDRIEFTDAPAKNPKRFEKLLPYAVALGLTSIWVRQFEGLLREPPQWYSGGPTFNGYLFGLSLGRLAMGMQSTFVSMPRAVPTTGRSAWGGHSTFGGGFSGGGFGGGGGRGW